MGGKRFFDILSDEKPTLTTSRRNFLAGSKLCVGAVVALGLDLVGRNSSARAACPAAIGCRCFLSGTRIKTNKGEVRIEELRIGDRVLTASGEDKPIKFIGRREISREYSEAWTGEGPVKISRFAIDGKAPHSDLYVSPAHAIYIDGLLIPVVNLINEINIVANPKLEALSLTYFHIELDTHEVILAEGLPVETFQRDGPDAFDNIDEYVRAYGPPGAPLTPFAPLASYNGRLQKLASHMRSAFAPACDFREQIDKIRDRIADRAELARAA